MSAREPGVEGGAGGGLAAAAAGGGVASARHIRISRVSPDVKLPIDSANSESPAAAVDTGPENGRRSCIDHLARRGAVGAAPGCMEANAGRGQRQPARRRAAAHDQSDLAAAAARCGDVRVAPKMGRKAQLGRYILQPCALRL
jgi:hypothetical protein